MATGKALLILALVAGTARAGKLVIGQPSTSGLKLSPIVDNEWKVGKLVVGGEYRWDELRFAPTKLSLGLKDKVREVPFAAKVVVSKPVSKAPRAVGSLAMGSLSKVKLELDTTSVLPKSVSAKRKVHKTLKLTPKLSPRKWKTSASKGAELGVEWELNGDRALLTSTVAYAARPRCEFKFNLDLEGKTRVYIEPLLGQDGKMTRYELERRLDDSLIDVAGFELFDDVLQCKANVPLSAARLNLPMITGALTPTLTVPLNKPRQLKFGLKHHFDL